MLLLLENSQTASHFILPKSLNFEGVFSFKKRLVRCTHALYTLHVELWNSIFDFEQLVGIICLFEKTISTK